MFKLIEFGMHKDHHKHVVVSTEKHGRKIDGHGESQDDFLVSMICAFGTYI